MLSDPPPDGPQKVGFLLIPQFPLFSFTAAVEPLRSANRMSGQELYAWEIFSADGEPIVSSSGIMLVADKSIQDVGDCPALIVCAGIDPQDYTEKKTFSCLRQLSRHGSHIGGISGGAYVLARAGLLNDHRCTIHWEYLTGFSEEFPDIDVTTKLYEIDRTMFTSAGAGATLDMMLHLIAQQHGHDLSVAVAEQFSHIGSNDPDTPQRMPVRRRLRISHPKLIAVIEQMEANLEDPIERDGLALSVGLSVRQVERLFIKYLNTTPARYYMDLRLKRAQMLLSQTAMSILDVSVACGFVSASHFSKSYREKFDHPPRQERAPVGRELGII
ncbi:MAG: GlxA family transcriptional regulator [Rhodospirillales bacterium]|nr:GlxA family transcriptional regulator [Rhodospirillales bacterium]MBT4040585.1 GlxA family transcriptional regulator [Rhodospirillales bacterium]MBT5522398.1 GlxA family transcriptional regulator [Rhodospirillales bacterium]MBT6109599.1 GlxA family transcriptional regulator [Rhodospirillales bacterium]